MSAPLASPVKPGTGPHRSRRRARIRLAQLLAMVCVLAGLIVPAAAVAAVSTATTAAAAPSPPFGLPFAVGEKAVLVQGPHTNNADVCSYPSPGSAPCNALDLAPSSGIVRAAGAGTVHLFSYCPNLVMIDHGDGWITGYYHLINITVTNGQQVQAGDPLGHISQAYGCGGYANVPHVHFFVKYSPTGWAGVGDPFQNTAIDQDLQGFTLGGWQISGRQWSSCMTYVSSGERECAGSSITNYGMGASTPTVAAALIPGTKAGYSLNGDGTLTPFGGAPAATQGGHQWPNWNIARSIAILPNGTGGYVLDGWGGIHPFAIGSNPTPPSASGGPYWSGWDIARGIVLNPAGTGGYLLDGWGGVHPFAIGSNPAPPGVSTGAYYDGWDVVDGIAIGADGATVAVVDSHDGIHTS